MLLQGIVYILTNKNITTLYTGVYYEVYDLLVDSIHREKQLKKWHREWKEKLISDFNPSWEDLSDSIGLDEEYMQSVKEAYENGYYDTETP